MRHKLIFLFGCFCLFLSSYVGYGQWSVNHETTLGLDKVVMHLSIEKKFSELIDGGAYIKGGSLIRHHYPEITPESLQKWSLLPRISEYNFPYSASDPGGEVSHGSTKMKMLGLGTYMNFNRALNNRKKDWFFIRFNLEGGYVQDNYSLTSNYESSVYGNSTGTKVKNGTFEFITIGAGTRAGYKRILDKKNRFSALAALGVSYYHPFYHNDMAGIGYSYPTPFFGVEYELSIGIGYLFKY